MLSAHRRPDPFGRKHQGPRRQEDDGLTSSPSVDTRRRFRYFWVSGITDVGNFPGTLDVIAVNMKRDLPNEDGRTF